MISTMTRDADRWAAHSCALSPAQGRRTCGGMRPEHGTRLSAFGPFLGGRGYAGTRQIQLLPSVQLIPSVEVNGSSKAVVVDGTSGPRSWSPPV